MDEASIAIKQLREEMRIQTIALIMMELRQSEAFKDSTGIQLATAARLLYDKACDAAHFQ